MPTTPELRPLWEAIVDHVTDHTDLNVGDGHKPAGDAPYVVLYLIDGGGLDGPVGDPEADLTTVVQATCVGRTQAEAMWVRDRVTRTFRTVPIDTPTGRAVMQVRTATPGGVTRDDDHQPPLWYCTPRFPITTTPA
jgi:hypothetical protein